MANNKIKKVDNHLPISMQDDMYVFEEICKLIETGFYTTHSALRMCNKDRNWLTKYVNSHKELQPQFAKSLDICKANSYANKLQKVNNAYNKLIEGQEVKEVTQIYDVNPNNVDMKQLVSEKVVTKQVGPNADMVIRSLNKMTDRFSNAPNHIVTGKVLLNFFTYIQNKGYDVEEILTYVEGYMQQIQGEQDM